MQYDFAHHERKHGRSCEHTEYLGKEQAEDALHVRTYTLADGKFVLTVVEGLDDELQEVDESAQ